MGGQFLGQIVEVATVAGQAMHADQHPRIVRLAPFGVGQSGKAAMAAQNLKIAPTHIFTPPVKLAPYGSLVVPSSA